MAVDTFGITALASVRAFFADPNNERMYQEWLKSKEGRSIAAKLACAPKPTLARAAKS